MGKTHSYSWQSPVPKQVPLLWITIQVSLPGTTFRFWISISGRLARCYFRLPTSSSVIRAEASWDPDWSRRPGALTEAPFGKMAPASGNDGEFVVSKHARKAFTGCQERRADGMGMPSNAQQCPAMPRKPRDAQRCPEMEGRGKVHVRCIEHGTHRFEGSHALGCGNQAEEMLVDPEAPSGWM